MRAPLLILLGMLLLSTGPQAMADPAPEKGYAVLYVLDGDGYFGTYSFAARLRGMYGELQPAIVVGIGYPEAEGDLKLMLERRQYDFTAATAGYTVQTRVFEGETHVSVPWAAVGPFLQFALPR